MSNTNTRFRILTSANTGSGFSPVHRDFRGTDDVLLLLTDGFREARRRDDELFGETRIVETVAAHRQASAREIFSALRDAVGQFCDGQPQQDDMTGIIVKVLEA